MVALLKWDYDVVDQGKNQPGPKGGMRRREYRAEFLRLWAQVPEHRTQADIAKHLGIHPSVISKYLSESADVAPSKATLLSLGRMLNLPVRLADEEATTTLRDNEFHTEEEEAQLVMALRRAERDPFRRKKLIRILGVLLDEMARPTSYRKSEGQKADTEVAPTEPEQVWRTALKNHDEVDSPPTRHSAP